MFIWPILNIYEAVLDISCTGEAIVRQLLARYSQRPILNHHQKESPKR